MAEGNGQSGGSVMAPDFKPTPPSRAYVSVRKDEVLLLEDILEDTPDWTVGCGLPRRHVVGSMAILRGATKPVRFQRTREELLAEIDPIPWWRRVWAWLSVSEPGGRREFATILWRDPDGRTG